ncbi:MAG: hypothetical protein JKY65_13810 [Planctomycetes bacterium]|nr:hypothetical protein [Planctomycetota bacterium]
MNPDADLTRVVRAEQFEREVERRVGRGYPRDVAELEVGLASPHLACAAEQVLQPRETHLEILTRWFPDPQG